MLKLLWADLKMILRNRQALFWSLMFPLLFTVIFGLFFGSSNSMSGTIAIVNQSQAPLAISITDGIKKQNIFNIQETQDLNHAKDDLKNNKISAVLYIPSNFTVPSPKSPPQSNAIEIFYDPGSGQVNSILSSFVNYYLTETSFKMQNAKPLFTIKQTRVGSNKPFGYFDFVLAGILGLALMNASIMGMAVGISKYKEDKILKRITTTPLPTWRFITSQVVSRLCLNAAQIALILTIGVYGFNGHINGNLLILIGLVAIGAILFQLLGFVIAAFAKGADAAQGMAQAISIPMMFLAGVFFPIDALPKWLFSIVQFLPLAPFLRMVRAVAIDAASPFTNPLNIVIVCGWIILLAGISLWKFRLSEE